jgi:hypothetical protein
MVRYVSRMMLSTGIIVGTLSCFVPAAVKAQSSLAPCPTDQTQKFDNCYGTYKSQGGDTYIGEFQNDQKSGFGAYEFADGGRYFGEFKNDELSGRGVYSLKNGDSYVGEFLGNKANGRGTYTYKSGDKYSGDVKNWLFNGQFLVTYVNGDSYSGFYENDKRKGDGVYQWKDGTKYVGRWDDGLPTSEGVLKDSQGRVLVGAQFTNTANLGSQGFTTPDILTYSGGEIRQTLKTVPNALSEVEVGDRRAEIFDDFSWRYSRKDCSAVIPDKLFFCGQGDTWRQQAEKTNEDAEAQYVHDDRNMALFIYEKTGSKDGMDASFMRSAILGFMTDEAKKNNGTVKVIEDGEVVLWGKEKAYRIVASGNSAGLKVVYANTNVNRENETLQIVTISIGETYTDAARALHEDFVRSTAYD